jgi:hypothetical protein
MTLTLFAWWSISPVNSKLILCLLFTGLIDHQANNVSHGGVLIAVTYEFLSNEAKELKTNCEMVWAELTISNARKCQICAYYF